tara:strand:+ start:180 stop:404 length:225 start_codon:yes stop_codon:yes gene_type:complete
MRNEPRGIMKAIEMRKLRKLRNISEDLRRAESRVDELRGVKWSLVHDLKELGHDFTASSEGMDVVLSAPPSMRF